MKAFMKRIGLAVAVLGLAVGAAGQAEADLIVYSDRAAFDAAASGQALIDFESVPTPGGLQFYGSSTGSAFPGVTFTEPVGRLFVLDPSIYLTSGTTKYLNMNNNGATELTATFTNPTIFAVGMDLASVFNWGQVADPGAIQITLSTGDVLNATVASDLDGTSQSMTFVGFISDVAFSGFTITDLSGGLMVDNFAFSSTPLAVVPEPSSLAGGLLGAALMGGAWLRRRRKVA